MPVSLRLHDRTGVLATLWPWLAERERNVSIFDHVPNLSFHGEHEQHNEIHNEYRPEHGNVEELKECTTHRNEDRLRCRVPKLELGQSSHERSKLFSLSGRQRWATLFVFAIHFPGGIDFGCEKGDEQIQMIDAERVGDYVEALRVDDA